VFHLLDIGERKRFEGELQHLADHDVLTGLFNRRRFEHELERAIANADRYEDRCAVLLIDLDGFKHVNDSMGHACGDELVTRVANMMRDALRDTDVVARLGGDEFAVILPHADATEGMMVAEKLVSILRADPIALSDNRFARVTASVGMTTFVANAGLSADELLVEADVAMYRAKELGKNQAFAFVRDSSPGAP
jgi:diguanylate cyclase (GGDEF)-like protein